MKTLALKTATTFYASVIALASVLCLSTSSAWAKTSNEDKIKSAIDDAAGALKKAVDQLGTDVAAVQNYLENYHWKGVIQDEASSGVATLSFMKFNGHKRAVVVKPGERIEGTVECSLDRNKCAPLSVYRVVLGIKGEGAQTTVCNYLGSAAGESIEPFTLIAPSKPGIYQVRFRVVESLLESSALKAWKDKAGNEPDGTTTIGVIVVQP